MKFSRKARHEVLILLLIISSVALVYQLLFGSAGYMRVRSYQEELQQLRLENARLRQENGKIIQSIEKLKSDPEELERIARDELDLARPGDIVITLPPEDTSRTDKP